jgi:hypothetical protein
VNKTSSPAAGEDATDELFPILGISPKTSNNLDFCRQSKAQAKRRFRATSPWTLQNERAER